MRKPVLVLLMTLAIMLGFAGVSLAGPSEGGNTKRPQNPPCDADHGHPAAKSPRCATPPTTTPPTTTPPACPAQSVPQVVNVDNQLVNACVVVVALGGQGEAVCRGGQIEVPVQTVDGVVTACATVVPRPAG